MPVGVSKSLASMFGTALVSSSGILTPRINWLVLGYLWDISGIGQGYGQVLDIPGVSFKVFRISLGYPKSRKDIPKSKTWYGISEN
jgi:hypothetical protein